MRSNRLVSAVAIVGLTALSPTAPALEPPINLIRAVHPIDGPADAGDRSGALTASDACPATNVGTLTNGSTIVGSTFGSADDFVARCGSRPGGPDEIFEFSVDFAGEWSFDTCTVPACWDTTLSIHEDRGGGCPGGLVACNGDGCDVCDYESAVSAFLDPTSTYYLIVDGWSTFAYGDFTVTTLLVVPGCMSDAECDDGLFCNGTETCDVPTGLCLPDPGPNGGNPCLTYEGYAAPCDEYPGSCPKPDSCFTWIADTVGSGYFFNENSHCSDLASWVFDDVQNSHHTTGVLDYYTTPIIARSTPSGASPLGTVFPVNQALFTVSPGSCNPLAQIAGSQCTNTATVDLGGRPPHPLPCSGTNPTLPNNSGNFAVCEIDFFIAYRTTENGAGFPIAGNKPHLGGPAAADDFGVSVYWLEDCPPTGTYSPSTFGDDENVPADFEGAVVCQKPGGRCCHPDGSCSLTTEADCDGEYGFTGTINGTDGGCGGDPDGDGVDNPCDNCPDDANPGQEDCDGDGAGDACDPEGDTDGPDGDGVCQGDDNCPFSNNPGQQDADGDGVGNACDICRGFDDNADNDGDGVPDGCDECPGSDDGEGGALADADGDGVLNCNDQCNGVDDTVFAPECDGAIPTTSQWGLIVLALLLLAGGKILFGIGAKRVACS